MKPKDLIKNFGFSPKENASGVYQKKYSKCKDYFIEIDFEKEKFNFGDLIKAESKTTQNFSQAENWVTLECVDRLLEKGYKPEDITLEKTFPSGHGHSGRLDILVEKSGSAFLMIECKTYGKEFDRELKNIHQKGGQLFTYFQNDTKAQYLMLYTSHLLNEKCDYKSEIIKVEEHYRSAGNVVDFYDRWNKVISQNGIFEDWVEAYTYENKLLTKHELQSLEESDSSFIFHEFLSILRKHSVSDKPNAFNKIFNLFLAKIYDEKKRENDELDFQWKEKSDDDVSFQIRLINLYQQGMLEFLRKEVEGINEQDFAHITTAEEIHKKKKKWLKFNNVFAIKEVVDDESFDDNARVLKEVVALLHKYQIRYPRKQQHLSDFFERLLTTGLKQESGQFFSPPPITRFIVKSLPIKESIINNLDSPTPKLPAAIDYAVGSGHFITEIMEEYQNVIDNLDTSNFFPDSKKQVEVWQHQQYDWAAKYIYGIEKDYRLVKVAKVGCYFYGDGLAQIIHGDGLDSFKNSKSYVGLLEQKSENANNEKFSYVVSNPPYSVSTFKGDLKNKNPDKDFELYKYLTDRSSEIECLFIERTKQLLKEGGIAAIVLPSSILSNTGIYTRARKIILQDFEIVAITELGSNTFMATGTNTVVLFLRRRRNSDAINIKTSVNQFFVNLRDVTINAIEKPVHKYITHVWEGIDFDDYSTLLKKQPNEAIRQHEIHQEYQKKIKATNEAEKWNAILALEQEKLLYFILTYSQEIVLVKTGNKKEEKAFLGYEFSNRRGSEGMHPIHRSKTIDECTQLYDTNLSNNPNKASTYIYKAFHREVNAEIPDNLKNNISYVNLVNMLTFDQVDFEKGISLVQKKKVNYEIIWNTTTLVLLNNIVEINKGSSITQEQTKTGEIPVVAGGHSPAYFHNEYNREGNVITVSASGAYAGFVNYYASPIFASDCNTIKSKNEEKIPTKLIFYYLKAIQKEIYELQRGQAQPHVYGEDLANIKVPLPPKEIQQKTIEKIEILEVKEDEATKRITQLQNLITDELQKLEKYPKRAIAVISENLDHKRKPVTRGHRVEGEIPYYGASGIVDYVSDYLINDHVLLISEDGANLKSRVHPIAFTANGKIWVNNHAHVLKFEHKETHKLVELYINKSDLSEFITGQAQPKLNQKNLNNIKIPLPPLSEQQKLVSEIEKTELQIAELEKLIKKIPFQKEAVLKKYL